MKVIISIFTVFCISEVAFAIEKIYGGDQIDITDAPYMVHIVYFKETGGAVYCGGSILRKNLILTAGHCTQDVTSGELMKAERYRIRVGSTQKHSEGIIHNVSTVFVHPKFNAGANRKHHDVGLLKLTGEIELNEKSQLVKLMHRKNTVNTGDTAKLAGWGDDPAVAHDYHLNQIEYTVIDSTVCALETLSDTPEGIEEHEICGRANNASACGGDSGGPLISTKTQEQIGITSFITGPCTTEHVPKLTIFSSIKDNMDYIQQIIKRTRRHQQ